MPSDFVSPSLEAPIEILLSSQPLACKIHGHVNSWETSPSLLTVTGTSQVVQWFLVRPTVLGKSLSKGNEAKGGFLSSLERLSHTLKNTMQMFFP